MIAPKHWSRFDGDRAQQQLLEGLDGSTVAKWLDLLRKRER
jgi:hypothetical protein